MSSVRVLLSASLFLIAAPSSLFARPPAALLNCSGPFARDASQATLIETFGAANVASADIDIGEGSTELGTVVFGKDPGRRLEVLWHDSARRRRPSTIAMRQGQNWMFVPPAPDQRRIYIGAAISEVEAINGRPFTILGFGWDNGGYAGDWSGGSLAKPGAGCTISLRFDPDRKARPGALDKVLGDKEFMSSSPAIRAVRPVVSSIAINWPE